MGRKNLELFGQMLMAALLPQESTNMFLAQFRRLQLT
jgi:hypothetical protein